MFKIPLRKIPQHWPGQTRFKLPIYGLKLLINDPFSADFGGESHLKSKTPKSTTRLKRVDDGDIDRLAVPHLYPS